MLSQTAKVENVVASSRVAAKTWQPSLILSPNLHVWINRRFARDKVAHLRLSHLERCPATIERFVMQHQKGV